MSYSRWGASRWYTFWACQDERTENRETARFMVCPFASFTAAELRADIEGCLDRAMQAEAAEVDEITPPVTEADREELRGYMLAFLADVDTKYRR